LPSKEACNVQGEIGLTTNATAWERADRVVPCSWLPMIPSSGKRAVR